MKSPSCRKGVGFRHVDRGFVVIGSDDDHHRAGFGAEALQASVFHGLPGEQPAR